MATENKKYIPALRFPEFQNDGEWNYEYGNMLYDSIVNKKHKSDLPILAITQDNGAIPRDEINYRVIVNDKSIEGYKIVEIGDFIISLRSFQGGIEYSRYKGLCSPAYIVLRKKHSKICDDFYRHYFKSFQYIQALNRNLEGIRDGKMVSYKQFSDIKLPCPSLAEQKKIADCLSSLDKYIEATKRKLDLLKEYKKGLMQRLFPAKGKTTPELRFPEFQNDGEWVEVPFGSIINVNSGKDYKHLDVGNIPVYGTGGYMLSVNDRLSDIDAVGIGRKGTIDKPQYLKAPFWTVDTLFFLTSSKNYDIRYLYYLCQTIPWKTYGEQTGVPSISKNSIDKLDVVITTNLVEQQKIAQSLLHLDNAMDAIKRKIHLLETHKYGLMQNLFPNLNNY